MKFFFLIFVFGLYLGLISGSAGVALRATAIKGQLNCGNKPYEGAFVRLFRSSGKEDNKEILDTRMTSPSGLYHIEGNTNGRPLNETDLDAYVRIYHKCGLDEKKNEYRKFGFKLPPQYVTNGRIAKKTYDAGILNLEVIFPKESKDKKFVENPQ
uniref:Transthyretin-like family-containing protein n=1 Tax=Strongyloides venezuelensis TaxID=75913 RepID=A0A0K0FMS1_STRVS